MKNYVCGGSLQLAALNPVSFLLLVSLFHVWFCQNLLLSRRLLLDLFLNYFCKSCWTYSHSKLLQPVLSEVAPVNSAPYKSRIRSWPWPKSHFLRPHTGLESAIVAAMARRSNILVGAVLLAGLAALNSVSFVNPQPVERSSRMAMKGSAVEWVPKLSRDVVEVMFTAPAQGARSRMLIRADADVSEVIKQGRKKLGFDQDWMPDSDFKLYNAEDEDAGPLKGKMSENGLVDFSYEIHLYYEPQ